jgi:hypothetical protein
MTDAASRKPSRLPLRFSLRVLLVAVTLFAIGFPIWYRRPYEETVVQAPSGDPFAAPGEMRITTTWQRQWGGGRLKHGVERVVRNGKTSWTTAFRDGKQHGLHQSFYVTGPLAEEGYYAAGKQHGVWKNYREDGTVRATTTWRRAQREGPASIAGKGGTYDLVFAPDRLLKVNGQRVVDPLGDRLAIGKVNAPALVDALKSPSGIEYIDLPMETVADNLSVNLRIPIVIDAAHVDPQVRVNCNATDIPLVVALAIMASERGLACDYRYGCVWITSAEDVKEWRDPTGIVGLVPPQGSQLAAAWNEPVALAVLKMPLAQALTNLTAMLAIELDLSQVTPAKEGDVDYPVTTKFNHLALHDALGVIVYQSGCRARLDGETLVILPPE